MLHTEENKIQDEEINFGEIWQTLWVGKLTIISVSLVFALASVLYALSQPNIYRASTILTPASSKGGSGGLGALASQFGGLASMAGINLGSGETDKTKIALEIIKSRSFIERFIAKHDLLVPIMAAENWNQLSGTLVIDEELYNPVTKKWLREATPPKSTEPSLWEAYSQFSQWLNIDYNKKSAIVIIDLEYFSPKLAQQWLEWLITDLNEFMRQEDFDEAKASINYLKNQLKGMEVAAMESVFYQLIEEQTKSMMLISVKTEYTLKTLDPPQVPEQKTKPKRALIIFLGTMLGGLLSVLLVLFRKK